MRSWISWVGPTALSVAIAACGGGSSADTGGSGEGDGADASGSTASGSETDSADGGSGGTDGAAVCIGLEDGESWEPGEIPGTTGYIYFHDRGNGIYAGLEGGEFAEVLDASLSSTPRLVPSPSRARVAFFKRDERVFIVEGTTSTALADWTDYEFIGWLDEDTVLVHRDGVVVSKQLDGTEGTPIEIECSNGGRPLAQAAGLSPDKTKLALTCGESYSARIGVLDLADGALTIFEDSGVEFNATPVWTENGFLVWPGAWDGGGVVHARWDDPSTMSGLAAQTFAFKPWGRNHVLVEMTPADATDELEHAWHALEIPCGEPVEISWLAELGPPLDPWELELSLDEARVLYAYNNALWVANVDGSGATMIDDRPPQTVAW